MQRFTSSQLVATTLLTQNLQLSRIEGQQQQQQYPAVSNDMDENMCDLNALSFIPC
jgi:hypothetical protein